MPNYDRDILVRIDGSNRTRLEQAIQSKSAAHLHFQPDDFRAPDEGPELDEFHHMMLSEAQRKRLNQALKDGQPEIVLVMRPSQIKQQGGFAFLAPLLGLLTKGALTTAVKAVAPAVALGALGGVSNSLARGATDAAVGNGLSDQLGAMKDAIMHNFTFRQPQIERLAKAIHNKERIALQLKPTQLDGEHALPLTQDMADKFMSAKQSGRGMSLKIDGGSLAAALDEHGEGRQHGGFLQFLVPALAGLAGSLFMGKGCASCGCDCQKKP